MSARRRSAAAVLIVNPNAGRLSDSGRSDVVDAVRARLDVEAYSTTARDTGITLAAEVAAAGAELVIAFGGDGHVNEVANGIAGTDTTLAIIPGGTMNVFARALGLPQDPLAAVDAIVEAKGKEPRWVPLGRMDDRYFTFSAGCGFDAEAAERVERYVPAKRRMGELFFYWSAFRILTSTYRHRDPTMTLTGPFGRVRVAMAIASNVGPYAYLMGRPITIAPKVDLDAGIDVFALKQMRIEALPLYMWRSIMSDGWAKHPDAVYHSDLESFEVTADEAFYRHVDGEPLAPARRASFSIERDVLKVLA